MRTTPSIEPIYCVYRHIRPDKNEPFYIGIGKTGNKREKDKRRNSYWEDIVNVNGGSYDIEIIMDDLTLKQASLKEKEFIELYGRIMNGSGTLANILPGGLVDKEYQKVSEEDKEFLRVSMTGNKHATGYKHTTSAKERIRVAHQGKPKPWLKGISPTAETCKKMSDAHKGNPSNTGRILISNETGERFIPKDQPIPDGWKRGHTKKHTWSQESKERISITRKGRKMNLSPEQRKRRSERSKGNAGSMGNFWINNGTTCMYIKVGESIPDGYTKGRIKTWLNQFEKVNSYKLTT